MTKCDSGLIDSRKYDDVILLGRILCQLNAFEPLPDTIRVKILKHFEKPKHGRWSEKHYCSNLTGYDYAVICSECEKPTYRQFAEPTPNYCPNCGTRMDGEENG